MNDGKVLLVNVTVENLTPCKKLLRIELPAPAVDGEFETITREFQRQVSLPGFRPGKAPRDRVLKKYEADITDEVKRKLIGNAYREAVKTQKLDVIGYPDIEEIQFGRGQVMQFAATVETAPEFQLPEYKGLAARREQSAVTDADVDRALLLLRERMTRFEPVSREAQRGDVAVVNYTGTVDGKPVTETAPTAKGLTEQSQFWVNLEPNSFIPGFGDQLIGAKAGEKRAVTVEFPSDFVTPQLAGKQGVYAVEVVEVREKFLPPLDEALATAYEAGSLDKLREGVRRDLENELNFKNNKSVRGQLVRALLDQITLDLPASALAHETRNVVYDIVRENQNRGVAKELIEKQKEEIYAAASAGAKDRVKAAFVFQKIAEKENIKVTQEELAQRVYQMAAMYQIPPEKFMKDLQKRNGFAEIHDQVLNEKVVDFLQQHAALADAKPEAAAPPAP
jgi:trigger factor